MMALTSAHLIFEVLMVLMVPKGLRVFRVPLVLTVLMAPRGLKVFKVSKDLRVPTALTPILIYLMIVQLRMSYGLLTRSLVSFPLSKTS